VRARLVWKLYRQSSEDRRYKVTKAIAVVAHDDDALLWAGASIRRTLSMDIGWDWTVVVMCVKDEERRKYLDDWGKALHIRTVGLPFYDYQEGPAFSKNDRAEMCHALLREVRDTEFDWVFTHSLRDDGEYAPHANHKEAALIAADPAAIGTGQVASFAYGAIYSSRGLAPVARPDASHYLQLTYEELQWKAEWCARAPSSDKQSLRNLGLPCPNPGAFVCAGSGLPSPFVRR
jgi:LmbE family N-acetylglucosaminyl deacetylase